MPVSAVKSIESLVPWHSYLSLLCVSVQKDSEEIVQAALDKLLNENKSITTVIVAHRLRTVRNADIIAVVNKGKIVEKGSHDDLMNLKDGYYKNMVAKSLGGTLASD